jgi:hypothetical protein
MFAIFNYAIIVYSFFVLREVCILPSLSSHGVNLTNAFRPLERAWRRWKRYFSEEIEPSRVTTSTLILSPPTNQGEISRRLDIWDREAL